MSSETIDSFNKILGKIEKDGHTVVSEKRFVKLLQNEVQLSEEEIKKDISQSQFLSCRQSVSGSVLISTLKSSLLESQVTEQLDRLSKAFQRKKQVVKLSEKDMRLGAKIKPSSQQIAAVNLACNNSVSIITGGPGTGKTTLILGLVRALKGLSLKIQLCAPTGKAAKRLGEATGLQKFKPSTIHRFFRSVSEGYHTDFDVMIVDEASMMDTGLLHNLLSNIPDGSQLILIGDKDQLPPIAPGQPFKDFIQGLEQKANDSTNIPEPTTKDGVSGIVVAAYGILRGIEPDQELKLQDHNFEFVECPKENIPNIVLDYYFSTIPQILGKSFDKIKDEIQILTPQRTGNAGVNALNLAIQERLTRRGNPLFSGQGKIPLEFFKFDRVMQMSNDYELGVMNGEVGHVLSATEEGMTIFINGVEVTYNREQAGNLQLAYATTIHKSQGSEYESIILPISGEHFYMLDQLGRNLIYTAITRGKSKVCMIGEREILKKVIKSEFRNQRNTGLRLEMQKKNLFKQFAFSRLTEIYRQK